MSPMNQARIESLRREIDRAQQRKKALQPGTEWYTEENRLIAECMQAISRLQSEVQL